jgi:hypothetical protein
LEITIVEAATNRAVKIQVKPHIPVGILVRGLIKAFECPKDAPPCYLARGRDKLLGPYEYWMSLEVAGIKDGDQLELVGRP